ncbi:MAG: hypothetical protein IKJ19_07300 [Clostridia bacterium]|nr:hypothetical protein [Clostridia bacterium]
MTYYLKRNSIKKYRRSIITINDFSRGIVTDRDSFLLPFNQATLAYNFNFLSGVLKDGFGIKECDLYQGSSPKFELTNQPKKLYYYKRFDKQINHYIDYLLVYCADGYIYKNIIGNDLEFEKIDELYFTSAPESVNYTYQGQDVIIFSTTNELKIYDGSNITVVEDCPSVTSICIHNERLFATEGGEKTSLWFSDDFDPTNWAVSLDEAGYIDLRDGRGSLIKVLSFGGYVYVFRNYGITRVTAYGNQAEFSVDGISSTSGKIYGNSITHCGDKIIYLAKDGFYSFTGGKPTKILERLQGVLSEIDNEDAKGAYFNGKYYCCFKIKTDEDTFEKVLLCYDIKSGDFTIARGLNLIDFCAMEAEKRCELLFICEGKDVIGTLSSKAQFFGESLQKVWRSGKSDLGVIKDKCLTKVYVNTLSPLKIRVKSEKESRTLHFVGSTSNQMQLASVRGDIFEIELICDTPNCKINNIALEYEYGR